MPVESKAMEHVKKVLGSFGDKYIENDTLKKNRVIEDLDAYDHELMEALLADEFIHEHYTEKIAGVEVFKLNQFISVFEFKNYWEDSYTKYSNKIGLSADGKFIDESADVVLDFPFKDTVLKAGMSKEDVEDSTDADEPFLNEVIAKAEIDELFEPKILVNAKKYDENNINGDSVHEISADDNLIIKGNNLIALHSLKQRYAGKVKLIYLDPPYYFNKMKATDAFMYNSNFKLSSWLTFMKNRLEISKKLLSNDGVILLSTGEDGQAYLKLLMDGVFGKNNFVETFIWRNTDNADSLSKKSRSGVEYIHAYENIKDPSRKWIGKESENGDAPLLNNGNGVTVKEFIPESVKFNIADGIYSAGKYGNIELLEDLEVKDGKNKNLLKMSGRFKWGQETIDAEIRKGTFFIIKTTNFSIRFQRKDASIMAPEKFIETRYLSKIFGVGTNEDGTSHLSALRLGFTNPKPETLLAFFIRAVTQEDDLVLDFFMGSATTQAVALKMKRRFIGIEQMDYIENISIPRLQKVILGEQGGISKDVNWQGGGSFVYAELMEKNQGYLHDLQKADTIRELMDVYARMKENADIDFRLDLEKFEEELDSFTTLEDRRKELVRILDKNQLYYNYANIDDANVKDLLSDSDYLFNKSFYQAKDGK